MAATAGVPKWINACKDSISTTKEWKTFTSDLHQAIQQQLKESRVSTFSDLTDAERSLFLERAAKAIQNGKSYTDFYAKVSHSLDQHINNEVARQLMEELPLATKSDLALDQAQEGAIALLRRWPDMKSKLRACFNQPLPGPIRQLAWRLNLENTKVRKIYLDLLATNPRAAISPIDLEISQKCEYLLKAEPTFEELKGSIGAFYAMKAMLSYYHCQKKTGVPLSDIKFMLAVPFVEVSSNKISRREPAPGKVVALLVEELISFLDTRPGYMSDSGSEADEKEMEGFAQKVGDYVKERSPDLANVVTKAYVPEQEKIVATEAGNKSALNDGMKRLTRPVIRFLFSGYLSMDVVLYIWDQYIIGSDVPEFHAHFLPALTATYLLLLKDKLINANTSADLETALKLESRKLKISQFQQQIKLHFYEEFSSLLKQDDVSGQPVLDPTQAPHAPWTHWYSERVPNRIGTEARRQARQERDAERNEQLIKHREAEGRRRQIEEAQRKEDYLKFIEQQEAAKFNFDRHRVQIDEMLQTERKKRIATERTSQKEIDRLRQEIEELKKWKPKSINGSVVSLDSVISRYVVPPPPSVASTPRPEQLRIIAHSPSPNRPADEQTRDVIIDFFKKVADGFNRVGHGIDAEREELDRSTIENIRDHKEDIKEAQIEVFGRQLHSNEFDNLPDSEKQEASNKIIEVVKRKMHERKRHDVS